MWSKLKLNEILMEKSHTIAESSFLKHEIAYFDFIF